MISAMARGDAAQLAAEGVNLTFEDCVRLNALGLRCEKNEHSAELFVLPRAAVLGDLTFREPTIADDIWLSECARHFNLDNDETAFLLRAYSIATPPERVPTSDRPRAVAAAVRKFVRKHCAAFTFRQLINAVSYAVNGNCPDTGEEPPLTDTPQSQMHGRTDGRACLSAGYLRCGVFRRLGSASELSRMTCGDVQLLIECDKAHVEGEAYWKDRRNDAAGDYIRALSEIRDRANEKGETK